MNDLVAAKLEIVSVLNRYATGCDTKEWDVLDTVFQEDALGIYGGVEYRSRDEIKKYIRERLGGVGTTQHLLSNYEVTVSETVASSACRLRAWHQGIGEWSGTTYEAFATYYDELSLAPNGWRICRRELIIEASLGTRDILGPA